LVDGKWYADKIDAPKPLTKDTAVALTASTSRSRGRILTSDTMMTKSSKPTALTNLHRTISLKATTAVARVVVVMVGVRASQRRFGFSWTTMFVVKYISKNQGSHQRIFGR
jgi:hypothetical protein